MHVSISLHKVVFQIYLYPLAPELNPVTVSVHHFSSSPLFPFHHLSLLSTTRITTTFLTALLRLRFLAPLLREDGFRVCGAVFLGRGGEFLGGLCSGAGFLGCLDAVVVVVVVVGFGHVGWGVCFAGEPGGFFFNFRFYSWCYVLR